eukprot:Sdes_comp18025_c0_seq1m7338
MDAETDDKVDDYVKKVDTVVLKERLNQALGDDAQQYWCLLMQYTRKKITKAELDRWAKNHLTGEKASLHNDLILGLLKNAQISSEEPSRLSRKRKTSNSARSHRKLQKTTQPHPVSDLFNLSSLPENQKNLTSFQQQNVGAPLLEHLLSLCAPPESLWVGEHAFRENEFPDIEQIRTRLYLDLYNSGVTELCDDFVVCAHKYLQNSVQKIIDRVLEWKFSLQQSTNPIESSPIEEPSSCLQSKLVLLPIDFYEVLRSDPSLIAGDMLCLEYILNSQTH